MLLSGGLDIWSSGRDCRGFLWGKRKPHRIVFPMSIKITLNSMNAPVENVNLLQMKVSKTSVAYKKHLHRHKRY